MSRGLRTAAAAVVALGLVAGSATAALALADEDDAPVEAVIEDTTPPRASVSGLMNNWPYELGTEFVLRFWCDDPESGIVSCEEEHGYRSGDVVRLDTLGRHSFSVTGVNGAGLEYTGTLEVAVQAGDLQPVRAVFSGSEESWNGWFNTPIDGRIRGASDTGQPITRIYYQLDGADWVLVSGDEAIIPFTAEGRYLLDFNALDEHDSFSTVQRQWVKLDFTAPDLVYPSGIDGGVFELGAVRALWAECGDELSGVDECGFDEGEYLPTDRPGVFTVTARAVDEAHNVVTRTLTYTVLDAEGQLPTQAADDESPAAPAPASPAAAPRTLATTGVESAGVGLLAVSGLVLVALGIGGAVLTRRMRATV